MNKFTFKNAMDEVFKSATLGNKAALFAYGRARQDFGKSDKDKKMGEVYIEGALTNGNDRETLERTYQGFYRPMFFMLANG